MPVLLEKIKMNELTQSDREEFKQLDFIVAKNMSAFVKVGHALGEIKSRKLFLAEYESFEQYTEARHGIKKRYANDLIRSSEVAQVLGATAPKAPATERQARELAKLPDADRQEVWQEVIDKSEKEEVPITADLIKEVAEPHKEQKKPRLNAKGGVYQPPRPEPEESVQIEDKKPVPVEAEPVQEPEETKQIEENPLIRLKETVKHCVDQIPPGSRHLAGLYLIEIGEGMIK